MVYQDVHQMNNLICSMLSINSGVIFLLHPNSRITPQNYEQIRMIWVSPKNKKTRKSAIYGLLNYFETGFSGEYRSRTDDLLHAMQAL